MADKAKRETQTIVDIAEYHTDVTKSLRDYLDRLYRDGDKRFIGKSITEYQTELTRKLAETDLRSSLALLTAVEALLREDYLLRAGTFRDDPLSTAFVALYQRRATRVRFEDLLELWKEYYPPLAMITSQLRAATHFRNWLAHGRYSQRPENGKFDYSSLYDLASATLQNFPLLTFEEGKP